MSHSNAKSLILEALPEQYAEAGPHLALVEPRNEGAIDSATRAIHALIMQKHVEPILRMEADEPIRAHWESVRREFRDALGGFRFAIRASGFKSSRSVDDKAYCETAKLVAGDDAAVEFAFASTTLERAHQLLTTIHQFEVPEERRDEDQKFAGVFNAHADLYWFGYLAMIGASGEEAGATQSAIRFAFRAMRDGSVGAYAAIRGGVDLRLPPPGDYDYDVAADVAEDMDLADADLA